MDHSNREIPFLDVLVRLQGNSISTSLYSKPTDNHQYLDFHSCHPVHLKKSIIFSQGLRIKRICSNVEDYEKQIAIFAGHLLNCRYPFKFISKEISKLSRFNRDDLLNYKEKRPNSRIPMVFDYHPSVEKLSKTLKSDFLLLREDNMIRDLFTDPPLHSRRQTQNLKGMLTSSKLPSESPRGNVKCMKPRCKICKIINTESPFQPPGTNFTIKAPPLSCDTPNVVYLLYCTICNSGNYVGETSTAFRLRFNNHTKSIRDNARGFPVAEHFNSPNHTTSNLPCILVSLGFASRESRKSAHYIGFSSLEPT